MIMRRSSVVVGACLAYARPALLCLREEKETAGVEVGLGLAGMY